MMLSSEVGAKHSNTGNVIAQKGVILKIEIVVVGQMKNAKPAKVAVVKIQHFLKTFAGIYKC